MEHGYQLLRRAAAFRALSQWDQVQLTDTKGLQAWERLLVPRERGISASSRPSLPNLLPPPPPGVLSQTLPTPLCHLNQFLLLLLCSSWSAPLPLKQALTVSPAALSHQQYPQ